MITINNIPINVTLFPDNTRQVWQLPKEITKLATVLVKWEFVTEGEFLELAQLKHLLDSLNISATLVFPYLPYGRQDKLVSNNTTFALRTFAKLLNSLKFHKVFAIDAHSKVAENVIDNFYSIPPVEYVFKIVKEIDPDLFCYPDAGALDKYHKLFVSRKLSIHGEKTRDQLTGNIDKYEIVGNCKDKSVLVVDDLCDGGATFVHLTTQLLKNGAKEVNLFVTHGIFSKGLTPLKEAGIKRIFTKDGEVVDQDSTNGLFVYKPYKELNNETSLGPFTT